MEVYFGLINDDGFTFGYAKNLCCKVKNRALAVAHLRSRIAFLFAIDFERSCEFSIVFVELAMRENGIPDIIKLVKCS